MAEVEGQPGVIGTKAVDVMSHQGVLDAMARHPESVVAISLDNNGRVFVHLEDHDGPIHVGNLKPKYFTQYGKLRVKSWKLTGGEPLQGYDRERLDGTKVSRLKYRGLNLHLVPVTSGDTVEV